MTSTKTALILGATGGVGGAIAKDLSRRGWTVRALVRDPRKAAADWRGAPSPIWLAGDAMNRDEVIAAAQGVSVIVHAVNPPGYRHWNRLLLPMIDNTIAAARAAGARIVLPGTLYNFDPKRTPTIDADTPQKPPSRKGAIRVQMERRLQDAAPEVRSLIVRAGDFFGPGARSSWFSQGMVKAGEPPRKLLNPAIGAGHSWAYLPDLAETIGQLIELGDQLAPFERLQFEGYYDATGHGMTDAVRRVLGRTVPVAAFPWWLMQLLAPFGGFPREAADVAIYWRHPARYDNRRLVALLGEEPRTPLDVAMSRALAELGCLDQPATALTLRLA